MGSAGTLTIRDAVAGDLPAIVVLLGDDMLGRSREGGAVDPAYEQALAAIMADPNGRQLVAERDGHVVGCFQLTVLPGLGRGGAWRAQIESVRVARAQRGQGLGALMMRWAIDRARERG